MISAPAPATAVAPPERIASGRQTGFTLVPRPGESVIEIWQRFARKLHDLEATPLQVLVFGNTTASAASAAAMQKLLGRADWPVTWVEGAACDTSPIAGVQAFCFSGGVERIALGGRVLASVFTEGGARHCLVGGFLSDRKLASRADQTAEALEKLQAVLALAGFDLGDTLRTWFYLDDILAWYPEFNQVRTKLYSGVKFRTGSLPASTGIGARNPDGAALALAAWALRPVSSGTNAEEVASPLQCPAPAYGSSFSRAMEIFSATRRQLFISGTASIAPGGETLWHNDTRRQLALTMDVVEAILESRGFTFADVTRAVAYFKHNCDAWLWRDWCAARGLEQMPVVVTRSAVCRDDLLFELEADAVM